MRQDYNSEKIVRSWTLVIGFVVIVLMSPMGLVRSVQAKPPATEAEMTAQHDMIKDDIAASQAAIQADISTLQTAVDALPKTCPPGDSDSGRFVTYNSASEVCDKTTGLFWQQRPDSVNLNPAAALAHCPTVGAGKRLPTIQELVSVLDYSEGNPTVTPGIFTNVGNTNYWSSTPKVFIPGNFWAVELPGGDMFHIDSSPTFRVWCVR